MAQVYAETQESSSSPIDTVLGRLAGVRKQGTGYKATCPAHDDQTASLSISTGKDGTVILYCHARCDTKDVVKALGLELRDLFPADVKRAPVKFLRKKIAATYDYPDEQGKLLFQVIRNEPKGFSQRRPNGQGGWIWNLGSVRRVLYRLPEVLASDDMIVLVEGEKDANRLHGLDIVATTAPGGASKWRPEYTATLAGREVVILPDNDDPGRGHANDVANELKNAGCRVTVVDLPGLDEHGDISDWLDMGFGVDDLVDLIRLTPEWGSSKTEAEDVVEPLAGQHVLADVKAFLGRFVAYPSEHEHIAHTLWIAHAHLMDSWESTPRIAFLSAEPSSGKTRALEITELLVPNPVEAVNVTPAYLFRKVGHEDGRPTILYDEIDTVFGPKAKDNEEIRGLLNAGHRVGAVAGRCVVKGKVIETEEIPAYCAVALAGIGDLPDTILSRSIVVRMRRRAAHEHVDAYRRRVHSPEGCAIRTHLAAWTYTVEAAARDAWPAMPPEVKDRDADIWEPLLAVADCAGGDWPDQARVAAVTLVTQSKGSTPSLGIRLLADLRALFQNQPQQSLHNVAQTRSLSSDFIVTELVKLPEAPWGELVGGKPLNARGLAKRLSQYGVSPKVVRIGSTTARGYTDDDLFDAWSRYLPTPPHESVTTVTSETGDTVEGRPS